MRVCECIGYENALQFNQLLWNKYFPTRWDDPLTSDQHSVVKTPVNAADMDCWSRQGF